MLAMFAALGFAVSARVLLFVNLVGAFALSVMAVYAESTSALIVLGLYGGLVTLPLVGLEMRNKRGRE